MATTLSKTRPRVSTQEYPSKVSLKSPAYPDGRSAREATPTFPHRSGRLSWLRASLSFPDMKEAPRVTGRPLDRSRESVLVVENLKRPSARSTHSTVSSDRDVFIDAGDDALEAYLLKRAARKVREDSTETHGKRRSNLNSKRSTESGLGHTRQTRSRDDGAGREPGSTARVASTEGDKVTSILKMSTKEKRQEARPERPVGERLDSADDLKPREQRHRHRRKSSNLSLDREEAKAGAQTARDSKHVEGSTKLASVTTEGTPGRERATKPTKSLESSTHKGPESTVLKDASSLPHKITTATESRSAAVTPEDKTEPQAASSRSHNGNANKPLTIQTTRPKLTDKPDLTAPSVPASGDSPLLPRLVRFGGDTVHQLELPPGRRLIPVGPKQKSRSRSPFLAPLDPKPLRDALPPALGSLRKLKRHLKNQKAMERYWQRTEKEEAEGRADAEREAEKDARRYRAKPSENPSPAREGERAKEKRSRLVRRSGSRKTTSPSDGPEKRDDTKETTSKHTSADQADAADYPPPPR